VSIYLLMRLTYIIMLIALIMASGCLGEKSVIKANVTITEHNGTPVIDSIDVTSLNVSKAEDHQQVSTHLPGVYMSTFWDSKQIDYWRSVDYKGSGQYEIISELKIIPNKGDSVDVYIKVHDNNGDELTASKATLKWE
jgi:hypothetical protein